jgi:parallel beta-helix repeat protein
LSVFQLHAKNYFVAPTGNDTTGTGAIDLPYRTIMKAQQFVLAGDTVFLRGGTYKMSESQIYLKSSIWAYINYLDKSGTSATKRICYHAYRDEKPIIDMSAVKPADYRNIVFYVKGSWLHIKGLEIIGTQVTITAHTQSECFRNEGGSNNIYEQCVMRDGMAIGFYLTKGANNLVLNCDAYNNWDSVSESGRGGNVDGFGFHGNKGSTGNVIRGCRAWLNSDDGYDCINNAENVVFDNCWAFYNGYSTGFVSRGDGNGFKIGGYGQAPSVPSLPNPIPAYTVKFCMAYRNKASGFYANHHVETGSFWYNNTAYRNSTNFNMLSQMITKSTKTGNDTTIDCAGIRHILKNNLSFKYSTQRDTLNMGTSTNQYNSFTPGIGVTVSADDFLSIDEALLVSPRQADGSLPKVNFLRLKQGSDLINNGVNLGFPYFGTSPDLGAFEFEESTALITPNGSIISVYPNPFINHIYITADNISVVQLFDIKGNIIDVFNARNNINLAFLKQGIYFIRIKTTDNESFVEKIVKL